VTACRARTSASRGPSRLHYDGAEWAGINSGTTEDLLGLTGASGHLFAVGKNATIVHYDGASWSVTRVPADIDLRGVWAASPRQVFAVGAQP
jgi:hypothetical protein